jgi:hypothetical protein
VDYPGCGGLSKYLSADQLYHFIHLPGQVVSIGIASIFGKWLSDFVGSILIFHSLNVKKISNKRKDISWRLISRG